MIMQQRGLLPAAGGGVRHGIRDVSRITGIEQARIRFFQRMFSGFLGESLDSDQFDEGQVALLSRVDKLVFTDGKSISEVREELAREQQSVQVISVTSGKGGVGKTTVAVNLAIAAAGRGARTLLFDGDMGMANVHVFTGIRPRATVMDLMDRRTPLESVLSDGPGGIKILCGGSGVAALAGLDSRGMEHLGRQLALLAGAFDLLVIDTGAGISADVLHFLGMSDDIVVVATPDIASTLDAYGVIKASRQAELNGRIHLLVNQVQKGEQYEAIAERICKCAEHFLRYTPNVLGYLPRDRALGLANQNRSPLVTSRPRTANAKRFRRLAAALTADTAGGEPKGNGLPHRMESLVHGLKTRADAQRQIPC